MLGVDEQLLALGFNKKGKLDVGVRNIFTEKSDAYILLKKYAWKMLSDLATRYPDEAQLSTETDKIKFYINGIWLFQFQFMWGSCYLTVTKRSKAINKYPGLLEVLNSSAGIIRKNNQDYYDIDLSKESLIIKSVELISNALDLFEIPNQVHTGAKESKRTYNMPETSLNQILYGPPGTGKTYHSIQMAVAAAEPGFYPEGETRDDVRQAYKAKYKELVKAGRIRFVTFHQSYGYEEFVEGLSAKTEGDQLSYFEKDGIFKTICLEAKKYRATNKNKQRSEFDERWQLFAEQLAESESGIKITTLSKKTYFTVTDVTSNTIRFDKSKGSSIHTLSAKTLKAVYDQEKQIVGGLQPYYAAFIEHLNQFELAVVEASSEQKNFVLIIDEINRGNISKVFGELITLIEASKRLGQTESLEAILPYSGDSFSVPDNLYLIGTMNTADRSLALMDTALRRRFDFVEMMPDYEVFSEYGQLNCGGIQVDLAKLLKTMNQRITALYDREHTLGHAFFIPVIELIKAGQHQDALSALAQCFQHKIIPLLAEYFFEDWQKIRLVLGDNQKDKNLQLIKQSDVNYSALFGDSDEVSDLADEAQAFSLISKDSKLWQSVNTYIAIYDASQLPKIED
ncbi:McrB family protein [Shewanella sp. SG44-2]|uniref:McrB family protein n=1 Tax=Shewanella sp. SG44-2 TaxID=2760962 RepID=UPI002175DB48|nr:AAA family ATPase [Shewanella sp. SG44-2]